METRVFTDLNGLIADFKFKKLDFIKSVKNPPLSVKIRVSID